VNYLESYNASEGFFGITDRQGADDLLLMLDYGIFFEFIPVEELHRDQPRTKLLHEVEPGRQCPGDQHQRRALALHAGRHGALHQREPLPDPSERPHAQLHQRLRGRADRGERRSRHRGRVPRPRVPW
jgi:hypothetical protein